MKIYLTRLKQLLTKERSFGKKQKKIYDISSAEWYGLQRLLIHKYTISQINEILNLNISKKDLIGNVWIQKTKGRLANDILKYANIFPLHKAIEISKKGITLKKDLYQNLVKKSIYPIFLILLSGILLFVFSELILPQMMTMLDTTNGSLPIILLILKGLITIIGISILLSITIGIYLFIQYQRNELHLDRLLRLKIVNEYISYETMSILQHFFLYNLSTLQSIAYLKDLTKNTLLEHLVVDLDQLMQSGKSFESTIELSKLSKNAKSYLLLGVRSNDIEFFMDTYFMKQEDDWSLLIKKYNIRLQMFAYSMVGIIVFIVYQIMLMPLDMLQQF